MPFISNPPQVTRSLSGTLKLLEDFIAMTSFRDTSSKLALIAALAAATLAGCNQSGPGNQTSAVLDQPPPLPLTTTDTAPSNAAPIGSALPAAPRATIGRVAAPRDRYAYADRAYQTSRVLGDTPPDYAFDYNGTRPWVWRSNRSTRVVERTPEGQRYYYYDAGQANPYLVQDPQYSYGYSNGQLVVVYDNQGRTLDPAFVDERADLAGRYLYRAKQLYNAALTRDRQAVAAARWQERRAAIDADRARWEQQQAQYADWRAYHDEHAAQQQAYWQDEQDRRAIEAQRYNDVLGSTYDQGRYDQRRQDVNVGGSGSSLATALVAAAAAYSLGRASDHHQNRDAAPPTQTQSQGGQQFGGPGDRNFDAGRRAQQQDQSRQQADQQRQLQFQQQQAQATAQAQQQDQQRQQADQQRQQAAAQSRAQADAQAAAQSRQQQQAQQDAARRNADQAQAARAQQAQQQAAADAARHQSDQAAQAQQRAQQDAARQAARDAAVAQQQQARAQQDAARRVVDQQRAQQAAALQAAQAQQQQVQTQQRVQEQAARVQQEQAKLAAAQKATADAQSRVATEQAKVAAQQAKVAAETKAKVVADAAKAQGAPSHPDKPNLGQHKGQRPDGPGQNDANKPQN